MTPFDVIPGDGPSILGQPHGGIWLPEGMADRLTPISQALADDGSYIGPLHDGLLPGATIVRWNVHRYVIDANGDPSGSSLYPGQNTTGHCPETDFDWAPLWQPGQAGDPVQAGRLRNDLSDVLLRPDRLAWPGVLSNASCPLSENPDA